MSSSASATTVLKSGGVKIRRTSRQTKEAKMDPDIHTCAGR